MRDVKSEQLERLDQIEAQIKALEEEKSNIFDRSFHGPESEKVCEDWIAETLGEVLVEPRSPKQVRGYIQGEGQAMAPPIMHPAGCLVAVRPCAEEFGKRTFLGMLLGDMATRIGIRYSKETETIEATFSGHNPAIWVFDLNRIVMGFESWWGAIENEEQLRNITDADIDNVFYVKALRAMQQKKCG